RAVDLAGDLDAGVVMLSFYYFVGDAAALFANFIKAPAHEPLDRIHGILRVRNSLALGHLTDQPLAGLCNGHHGRRRSRALLVWDDHRLAALHYGDNRVSRAQVNSNNLAHKSDSSQCLAQTA